MNPVDEAIGLIADYTDTYEIKSDEAYSTARACLTDSIGCAILALKYKECAKLLGPIIPGTLVPNGARIPGTQFVLDPVLGAFNIGTMIRWLDYNDTFLAAEWGHPSDNLGGILAVADVTSRNLRTVNMKPLIMKDVLTFMIKAHEIQGVIALLNSFNRVGFDHVILVKVATAAVVTKMLGGSRQQIINAVSNAWADAGPLRTYRHAPNTGSRKSWAAGDATSRGTFFAFMSINGEMGYPSVLSTPRWGLYDVMMKGKPFQFDRPLSSYVMENVLFKISYPAEFHAQTAVEAAIKLHPEVKNRLDKIQSIDVNTHESAIRIIDKKGPLNNPADRDHCLQYMIAIGLIYGTLNADHYEDRFASDGRIDELRSKMVVKENPHFSTDYHDPNKRSIANELTIHFEDGSTLGPVLVEYPLGHKRRRQEGIPILYQKFLNNMLTRFEPKKTAAILEIMKQPEFLDTMPVDLFMDMFYGQ